MATTGTLHDELVDELRLLVDGLKDDTDRGSGAREYLNGLLRDVYVLEETAKSAGDSEDGGWIAPFVETAVVKLGIGPTILPQHSDAFKATCGRVSDLLARSELLAQLRSEVPALLGKLRPRARGRLEKAGVVAALESKRLLQRQGGPTPEAALAARLAEGLALHLALDLAEGKQDDLHEDLRGRINRLQGWLSERGATANEPDKGADAREGTLAVQGSLRAPGARAGQVAEVIVGGFTLDGATLSHPVVVASAGAEAKVLSAARELLGGVAEADARRILPFLEAVGAALNARMEDPEASDADRAAAALDVVGAVLPVLDEPSSQQAMLEALREDFSGKETEILLPVPGSPMAEGVGWEARDVFSRDVEVGTIVKLLRPGIKLAGEVVRPALVQVSQGPPPPSVLDEVLELLPEDEERAKHLADRLERARCQAAGDAGAQQARELADLALFIRDDFLADPARRALRMVLDEPPQALAGAEGWEDVREFLDENLETFWEDGENGEIAVHRLTRPYLQGLRTHDLAGARLRALGESMNAMLSLYDEVLGETARSWLFAQLERLSAEGGIQTGGHARRLMRTAARSVGRFYKDGELTPAMELTQALSTAGVKIFPEDESKLRRCPAPGAIFHKLDGRYDPKAPRFAVLGGFEPAATTKPSEEEPGVTETGAVTVSLGPEPRLIEILNSDELKGSRIGGAAARLIEETTRLDQARLKGELKGDAAAEQAFARGLAEAINEVLAESGWRRGDESRASLSPLFDCLREEYHLELLPGFVTYRRLRELQESFADQVKVDVVREGPKQITLNSLGAVYRDDLLAPLDMTWGVGPPPPYVAVLRQEVDWIDQVLKGESPRISLSPASIEAIKDFESPDAGSVEGIVRALGVIVTWLANEVPDELPAFSKAVKNAPGLEFDFFPLPGATYSNERLLGAVEASRSAGAIEVVRDPAREDGQAVAVTKIAIYKEGRLIGDEPRARFALKSLPKACEELGKALDPVLKSAQVVGTVKAQLKGHLTRLSLLPPGGDGERAAQLAAFRTLYDGRLIDPSYDPSPESKLHEAGAYLAGKLADAGLLKVERFEGKKTLADALAGYDAEEHVEVEKVFAVAGSAELAEVRRPLALLEGTVLQKGQLMQGVPSSDSELLEFDRVLVDSLDRVRNWVDGAGALIDDELDESGKQILPRTIKRISDVRRKMFEKAEQNKPVLPPDTARRDLIRFVIDQVHRAEDSLAVLEDKSFRNAFGDAVFKEIVFRSAGPYLSNKYGISIDTAVVAGADIQALVGKFKKEDKGPKPKVENNKVFSVVVPCYQQSGVTIREALVRVGVY
ncbi:MAG TPA: hypothetical protein DEA08_16080 [Planctomycetes bacterium]|nr:hypothetical protein [Planctomycetota bacterium]